MRVGMKSNYKHSISKIMRIISHIIFNKKELNKGSAKGQGTLKRRRRWAKPLKKS